MNPPPTPPEEGSQCRGTLVEFPSWEGPGVGRSWFKLDDSRIRQRGHEPAGRGRIEDEDENDDEDEGAVRG
ncbi:MAG: hypothetical protein DME22_07545 [Verrucomicrobia bacterium]|nr:MAG: hypothetical protein DME22_07545 [Verrucomicrobiota bacterium]PYJ98061.1 MAG: hypothetical protein DME23_13150 [Verrucomicrobiota bacterium]